MRGVIEASPNRTRKEETMAWTTPTIEELTCGMEINMYFPADEDDSTLF